MTQIMLTKTIEPQGERFVFHRAASIGAVATDFGEAIALLAEQPGIGAEYIGSKTPDVRRLFLSRVRYFVYYRADDQNLNVLAFWHSSREPQPLL